MVDKKIVQCRKCILDTTVKDIEFDDEGICNYCKAYNKIIATVPTGIEAEAKLNEIVEQIKRNGKNKEYDCLIGLSGGVDSTYLAYLVVSNGLRPLVVHIDTGWNSEIAVQNIQNVVTKLNLDLFTYVIDWDEMKDLQLSFFKASVPDCDIPQDHVFPALLNRIAKKYNIRDIISGHNLVTEFISPKGWLYDSNDLVHILDIQKKFGSVKLKKYPKFSLIDKWMYKFIYKIKSHRLLYYVPYNKNKVKEFISKEFDWKDYGGKHFESRFTKFFQSYYLPIKFGFDKRKSHLSNLILSDQITRDFALNELSKTVYDKKTIEEDTAYILKKLGINETQWDNILNAPLKKHSDYKRQNDLFLFKIYKRLFKK